MAEDKFSLYSDGGMGNDKNGEKCFNFKAGKLDMPSDIRSRYRLGLGFASLNHNAISTYYTPHNRNIFSIMIIQTKLAN